LPHTSSSGSSDCVEEISDGAILIGGRVVNEISPKDRDVTMVFQNYALYPHMTVAQNLAFGLKLRKIDKSEVRRRVVAAASTLGLEDYLERKPGALSGGQRQRVAMGRAIVREPHAYLMDEPLSTSTLSCACRCGPRSTSSSASLESPRSTSRTIRPRR
jgi:multiple sugar transport system ATP-binding protein